MKISLKIILSLTLIYILYSKGGIDPKLIDFSFDSIKIYLLVAFLIIFSIFLSTLRFYIIFNTLIDKISFHYLFRINCISIFFNQCLPGAQGGDIVKGIYLIKKYKSFNKMTIVSCIIIDRLFGLIALFSLFLISLYFLSNHNETLIKLFYIFFGSSLFLLLLFYIFIYCNLVDFLKNKILKNNNYFIVVINKFLNELINLKNFSTFKICKLLTLSILIFIISISGLIILKNDSFNVNSIIIMFFMSSVSFFSNSVPISFNGLGVGEYVFSQLSKIFYNNNIVLFGNIFLIFRALIIITSLPGLILFLVFKKNN